MNRPRPPCVHVGLPKTASTTLQKALFSGHSQVEFLGKWFGRYARAAPRRCSSKAAFELGNQLFWDHADSIDIGEARRLHREVILPEVDPGKTLVYSFEGLATARLERRRAIASNLREVFGDCRVIIGIRQPVGLVEAIFFLRMKQRHLGRRAGRFDFLRSPSPEGWLEAVVAGRELSGHLDYARTIRIFVEVLGRANVGVFALERLRVSPTDFARELCGFIGIDAEEGVRLLGGRRHNVRQSRGVADRMLRFERGGTGSILYGMAGRALRKRILERPGDGGESRARLPIPEAVRESIEARTRSGNRWIAKEWGLPLGEFGYPV